MKLPIEYTKKMKNLLGQDFEKYITSLSQKSYQGLRANTLKISAEKLKALLQYDLTPISWCDTGFYFKDDVRPSKSLFYNAGLFYIQEPSAMSTGSIIPIEKNDKVLDMCAAPGGKSTQVASKLQGTGVLVSNDISATRCKALLKNIEINGISNCIITNETPKNLSEKFQGYFNKIIIDAPCSGEGMFRKDKEMIKNWEPEKIKMYSLVQMEILSYANEMLENGGIIAYSTCTFAPEENEEILNNFLLRNKNFKLIDFDKYNSFEDARLDWISSDDKILDLKKAGRLMPYKVNGEGHFLALLKKDGQPKNIPIKKIAPVNKKYIEDAEIFFEKNLNIPMFENLKIYKTSLFSVPESIDLSKLRVVKSGFYLGELKTKRFEPSQAFAMALKMEDAKNIVNFNINDENLVRYLKGESFNIDKKIDGWYLVCLESYPLGWAKIQKNRLKNKYSAGWRIQ